MNRSGILQQAEKMVCGHREQDYGTPENNFDIIARLWTAYRGHAFNAVDVAMMMALLKIARIKTGTATEDSFIDLCGYGACGGEIATTVRNIEMTEDLIIHKDKNGNPLLYENAYGLFSPDEYQKHLREKAEAEIKPGGSENEN